MKISKNIDLFQLHLPKKPLPIILFLSLCLNLIVAPAVYATTNGQIDRFSAWTIGLLGLLTLALSIYLFVVIFQPERF